MNKRQITPEVMMAKAETACSSARVLLERGDADGAANRAYYAMFDATRAALLASGAPVDPNAVRTHRGLIRLFGEFLVKDGPISKDMWRFLNEAFEIRLTADYDGQFVEPVDAQKVVDQAEAFIAALRAEFMPDNRG